MPTKAEMYAQMAEKVAVQLTGSWQEWAGFLTTAARLYKYPYHEQLMIYAQRPDATACAEYDLWNDRMGRYVRRGSKGIALVDDSGDRPRLRYVFDISDTGTREHSRTPWLWQLEERHIGPVSAMLERNYDVSSNDLAQQLADVAAKLAEEYWDEHRQDILYIVDGSFLEEYDEYNIEVQFKSAATVSITYALMSRCGLEPEQYFGHEDFMPIFDFNTPAAIGALGTAVSQVNQQVLRQIGVTIQNYEREQLAERSVTHGEQPDLHEERRLPDSRPEPERAAVEAPGQVRQDAQNVPEGASAHPVQPAADEREAVPAPSGDRRDREQPSGADDAPAGRGGGRDGGAESPRPDAVGGPDEHLQGPGRGDSDGGAYQQLSLNLFLSEAEQIQKIDEAESVKTPSASSFAQEQPQPEAGDYEAEAVKPTLRELHEKYKPIVLEAVTEDTRYRNACGHSDYESAVIEGRSAIRRAVLSSGNRELLQLYSYTPEFRQRLHKEIIDETYPRLHELLRPLSQDDIDDAIRAWNGDVASKRAVVHYMADHAREKDTAAWLAREYSGGDSTKLLLARAGSSVEMELPWPKVQRRIAQLIADGTFLTEQERQPERQEQDARRYQVVVYHHSENGFDERMEYPTREEAEKVAQGYVDGTMEPDGFAYDGAAVYDLEQRTYLRIFGNYPDEAAQAQVTPPDLSGQPVTREGDTITIGNEEPTHEIDITVSDEEYEAIQQATPEEKVYDPTAPVYHEGDTVYLENQEYQITELRADTVQLLPSGMAYPIFRAESRERFETLLREDARNEAITEFLPINPDTADQDLRDVLAHGLIGAPDKAEISELLRSGESNAEIAQWLSRAYPDIIETMELETGDTADYRTMTEGIELEVLDADEKRLAMLFFRWDEVAPLLRGLYARQLDGFGQEQAEPAVEAAATVEEPAEAAKLIEEPATEAPAFHSEPVAVYPGEHNHLPYDVVVERLHIGEPEPTPPEPISAADAEEKPDHPVAIPVNGEWQTFPNQRAAEQAAYQEYRDNLRRNAENFRITDDHLGEGGPKAKYQANVAAIKLLKYRPGHAGAAGGIVPLCWLGRPGRCL